MREHPAWGQQCWQSVGVLEEATAERTAPPAAVEGDFLCLESIHSDAYIHFFAIVDSVKNHPASFDSLTPTLFCLPSRELLLAVYGQPYVFSIHREKQ